MSGTFDQVMYKRHHTKMVREGRYLAEVDVELMEMEGGWSPYLSLEDAYKLDNIRDALRQSDIPRASRLARIFTLTPVAV
jgi:hypothetical protein